MASVGANGGSAPDYHELGRLREVIIGEFDRVKHDKAREHLVLEEMTLMEIPSLPLQFTHIATLYALDTSKTGKVTLDMLLQMVSFAHNQRASCQDHELQSYLEGIFVFRLWQDMASKGTEFVASWLLRAVLQNAPLHEFEHYPDSLYIFRDSIMPLYKLSRRLASKDLSFQDFFDQLQACGEDLGQLELEDDSLDDFVPVPVVACFINSLFVGFAQLMKRIGMSTSTKTLQKSVAAASTSAPSPPIGGTRAGSMMTQSTQQAPRQ